MPCLVRLLGVSLTSAVTFAATLTDLTIRNHHLDDIFSALAREKPERHNVRFIPWTSHSSNVIDAVNVSAGRM